MEPPRILLMATDRGLAEQVRRALRILPHPGVEVDVALTVGAAREQLDFRPYHLLIAGLPEFVELSEEEDGEAPGGVPVVLVGGRPGARPPGSNGFALVPLPLSLNLLVTSVVRELRFPLRGRGTGSERYRDSVGS